MPDAPAASPATPSAPLMQDSLVFFGSGPVAAEALTCLAKSFIIEAVITKPQPPHHKEAFPVLVVAEHLGLKTFTPDGKQALSDLFATQPVTSRLGVVIDYGFIINQDVIDYFPLGIVNSHFSLLPEWRGADPITYSILSGQSTTGVSLMLIVAAMDEGPLLAQATYAIQADETTPSLTTALIEVSDQLLSEHLPAYAAGQLQPQPQTGGPTYSHKLSKEDGLLDFTKPAVQLEREIRAYLEWPKSRTQLAGRDVVVTQATVVDHSGTPGQAIKDGKQLLIFCSEQALSIQKLKPAGKAEMTAEAFLAGYGSQL